MVDETRRRRYGPEPLALTEKREHTVSTRLNDAELERLDSLRAPVQMQRGEYLRAAALDRLPPMIPAINREAWVALSRSAANLNQISARLNARDQVGVEEIRAVLADFRRSLLARDTGSGGTTMKAKVGTRSGFSRSPRLRPWTKVPGPPVRRSRKSSVEP
jgi:hypothetical protein